MKGKSFTALTGFSERKIRNPDVRVSHHATNERKKESSPAAQARLVRSSAATKSKWFVAGKNVSNQFYPPFSP